MVENRFEERIVCGLVEESTCEREKYVGAFFRNRQLVIANSSSEDHDEQVEEMVIHRPKVKFLSAIRRVLIYLASGFGLIWFSFGI